jgi:hypothetical protein
MADKRRKVRKIIEIVDGYWLPNVSKVTREGKFGAEAWVISDCFCQPLGNYNRKVRITVEELK